MRGPFVAVSLLLTLVGEAAYAPPQNPVAAVYPRVNIAHPHEFLLQVKSVGVLVENLRPGSEQVGITRDQIRTTIELGLRKSGIDVRGQEKLIDGEGCYSTLYVNVNVVGADSNNPVCAVNTSIEFLDDIALARRSLSKARFGIACLWNRSAVGVYPRQSVDSQAMSQLQTLVDFFCNDYLKANPKK